MNPNENPPYLDAILAGKVFLQMASPIEAFSGNALYSWRGIKAMKQYKTVKEVCALTGLTRKHLYYFHHENIVRAVSYANYSVEGNDGYKLYDDAAVEKLQQIALYYQLGLKRNEIRDIMLDPDYDRNLVLEHLLEQERIKKVRTERHIAALEYLRMTGLKNGLAGAFCVTSLEKLGQTLLNLQESELFRSNLRQKLVAFEEELAALLDELGNLSEDNLFSPQGSALMERIFDCGNRHLGANSIPFLAGLFVSAAGEGELAPAFHGKFTTAQSKAVMQYIRNHSELQK